MSNKHGQMNKKEVMSFRMSVPPSSSGTLVERVKADGTVEEARVRFYQGQQKSLQVQPYIAHKGDKHESLITYSSGSDQFLSGDDDYLVFPCIMSVEYDDNIVIHYSNTDPTNTYTLVVDVIVDYFGGTDRVIGGVVRG